MATTYTLGDLRRAVDALPPGSSITLPQELLVQALIGNGDVTAPPAPEAPDRLLTAEEAAQRLGVSKRYVYGRAKTFPFTKRLSPKVLRFSERGLERWLARTAR